MFPTRITVGSGLNSDSSGVGAQTCTGHCQRTRGQLPNKHAHRARPAATAQAAAPLAVQMAPCCDLMPDRAPRALLCLRGAAAAAAAVPRGRRPKGAAADPAGALTPNVLAPPRAPHRAGGRCGHEDGQHSSQCGHHILKRRQGRQGRRRACSGWSWDCEGTAAAEAGQSICLACN